MEGIDEIGTDRISKAAKAAAPETARLTALGNAYLAAKTLAEHVELNPRGPVGTMLSDRFGIDPAVVDADYAFDLGIGLDPESARLTVMARTAGGGAAFVQGRATNPGASVRWIGLRNPESGRWDAAGTVGRVTGKRTVLLTEGLSDALTAAVLDEYDVATVRGAAMAGRVVELTEALIGRDIVICADADPAGRKFANAVAQALGTVAASVRVARMPDGYDVGDLRAEDVTTFAERLRVLVEHADDALIDAGNVDVEGLLHGHAADVDRATVIRDYLLGLGLDVAYSDALGWLLWDGVSWGTNAESRVRQVVHRLGRILRHKAAEATLAGDEYRTRQLSKQATLMLTGMRIDAALKELRHSAGVTADVADYDANPDLLACANGTIDLRSGELRPSRKEDRLTRRLGIEYDPDAKAPQWEKFLSEVFIDEAGNPMPDVAEYLQALVGYGITGRTSEQIFAFLRGNGANGKGVLVESLADVFSAVTVTTPFETFEERRSGGIPND